MLKSIDPVSKNILHNHVIIEVNVGGKHPNVAGLHLNGWVMPAGRVKISQTKQHVRLIQDVSGMMVDLLNMVWLCGNHLVILIVGD